MNARLSQEKDSMMNIMQTQINRAINSAITDRIIPEMQNLFGSLPSDQNGTGLSTTVNDQGFCYSWRESNINITKKDSRSAFDPREDADITPYNTRSETLLGSEQFEVSKDQNQKCNNFRISFPVFRQSKVLCVI